MPVVNEIGHRLRWCDSEGYCGIPILVPDSSLKYRLPHCGGKRWEQILNCNGQHGRLSYHPQAIIS